MLVNFNTEIVDVVSGKAFRDEGDQIMTLRIASIRALVTPFKGEEGLAADKKVERWELALRLKQQPDPFEVTAEEVVKIKELMNKLYGPGIIGPAYKLFKEAGA